MDNSTGDKISADLGMWNFGEGVEKKFDSHVRKSVPGYDLSHQLVSLLSDPFIKKGRKLLTWVVRQALLIGSCLIGIEKRILK